MKFFGKLTSLSKIMETTLVFFFFLVEERIFITVSQGIL